MSEIKTELFAEKDSNENESTEFILTQIKQEPGIIIEDEFETEKIRKYLQKNEITEEDRSNLVWQSCIICEERFLSTEDLSLHVQTHKEPEFFQFEPIKEEISNFKRDFQCLQCLEFYPSQESLDNHLKIHIEKPYYTECESLNEDPLEINNEIHKSAEQDVLEVNRRRKCCIVGCENDSLQDKSRRFFAFPLVNSDKWNRWLTACKMSIGYIAKLKKPLICDSHFERKFIGKRKLFPEAIPTLNLDNLPSAAAVEQSSSSTSHIVYQIEELDEIDPLRIQSSDNEFETSSSDCLLKNEPDLDNSQSEVVSLKEMSTRKRKCCIVGCNSNSLENKNKRFFAFPLINSNKWHQWVTLCNLPIDIFNKLKKPLICDSHFERKFFGKKKLFPEAIPTLGLDNLPATEFSTSQHVDIIYKYLQENKKTLYTNRKINRNKDVERRKILLIMEN